MWISVYYGVEWILPIGVVTKPCFGTMAGVPALERKMHACDAPLHDIHYDINMGYQAIFDR
jgi:hypothetical protein